MTPYQKAGFNELTLFQIPKYLGSSGTVCYVTGAVLPFDVCAIRCANDSAMDAVVKIIDLRELPKDADGFYPHDGGECPVPGNWEVQVRFFGNPYSYSCVQRADCCKWEHSETTGKIVAFKPISRPGMPRHSEPINQAESPVAAGSECDISADTSALDVQEGYEKLAAVLQCALDQAQGGKGAERHAQGQPFHEQPMQRISQLIGSRDGMAFQAIKKIQESQRFEEPERVINELLGAINYVAGMIIYLEDEALEQQEGDK